MGISLMGIISNEQPLTLQSYQSRSLPFSNQRLVNVYAEEGPQGAKSQVLLVGTPGTVNFATVGGVGPIRGMEVMGDVLYVVSGTSLFSVSSVGAPSNLGNVGGTGPVTMANNGFQLCVVSNRNGFIYNVNTGTFAQITDSDFGNADSVTFIDGYFVFNNGSRIFHSDLEDGTAYDPLAFANADYDPDTALRVFRNRSDLWVFGPNSTQFYRNVGTSPFAFAPIQGAVLETGLLSRDAVAIQSNTLYWFGVDARGGRKVYRAQGYLPVRVSTHALERQWEQYDSPDDAIMFSYTQEGHDFVVLTLPDFGTYVFDATTGLWHERQSFGVDFWRMQTFAHIYNRRLVGDTRSGRIFELDLDANTDADPITAEDARIERIINTQTIFTPNNTFLRHNRLRIDFDTGGTVAASDIIQTTCATAVSASQNFITVADATGVAVNDVAIIELDNGTYTPDLRVISVSSNTVNLSSVFNNVAVGNNVIFGPANSNLQQPDPEVTLSWADDGSTTFTTGQSRSLGTYGETTHRVYWNILGKSRSRVYRLTTTDKVDWLIKGMYLWTTGARGNG